MIELLNKYKNPYAQIHVIIRLLLLSGCRISEVLQLKREHVDPSGLVCIPQSKTDSFRLFYFPEILLFISRHDFKPHNLLFDLTYKNMYTYCKQNMPQLVSGKQYKNKIVTHVFRHMLIKHVSEVFPKFYDKIDHLVGHKTRKTRNYYERRTKHGKAN